MSSPPPPSASQSLSIDLAHSSQPKTKKESLEDVLAHPFPPFEVESMASAYDEESMKMAEFENGMS